MIMQYVSLVLLMFFISFFADVFYRFIRYKTIIPQKMFTFKKGGLFEHYIIVGGLTLLIVSIHVAFGVSPFGDNLLSGFINIVTFSLVGYVFLVFTFIFLFYFVSFLYTKLDRRIQNRSEFYQQYSPKMIMTAIIISGILIFFVFMVGLITLFR